MLALKNLVFSFLIFCFVCSSQAYAHRTDNSYGSSVSKEPEEQVEPIVVRVTGYGAYDKKEDAESESKRLMAIRASKLDAYRALAERIYGIGIRGGSKVDEFVLKNDGYAAVVDSYVRGARVVSIIENKGRGFETVLEVLLPGKFHECLNKTNNLKYDTDCLVPFSMTGSGEVSSTSSGSQVMQSIYHLK